MDISIVIPALNEAPKIGRDIAVAAAFIKSAGFEGEVIIVDDGSTDGTAEAAVRAAIPLNVGKRIIRLEKNIGKGASVRRGILESRGRVVIYADSGTCIPYANALPVLEKISAGGLDIGLASRRLKQTVILRNQSLGRRIISRLFHGSAVVIAGLPKTITDSQCGFKVYRGEIARDLFAGLVTAGFMFELEIILKALRRGLRVEEFPVEWTCDLDTRLRPSAHAGSVLKEIFAIRGIVKKNSDSSAQG